MAAIIAMTLGLSFLCVECVLRMIARGLGAGAALEPVAVRSGVIQPDAARPRSERQINSRLRAIAAQ
jgi:hypothetical protein